MDAAATAQREGEADVGLDSLSQDKPWDICLERVTRQRKGPPKELKNGVG